MDADGPGIRAVVPPWGGETAIDLLPLLDWDALREAEPTWLVGYSDMSTLMVPLTLLAGVATVHGNNLMDTAYRPPDGMVSWLDIVRLDRGAAFTQTSPGRYATGWDDYVNDPDVRDLTLDAQGRWTRLDGDGDVDVSGRLLGGCIDTLCNVAGTPFCDVARFAEREAPEGVIGYVEADAADATATCRHLHGMRLAGFFTGATAVLVGRTRAPDVDTLTQHEAVLDALGSLDVPIVAEVECGHVPPFMPLVNGALARVVLTEDHAEVTQTLSRPAAGPWRP